MVQDLLEEEAVGAEWGGGDFESHILGDPIYKLRTQMMITISPDTKLGDVVQQLAKWGRGAALVVDSGKLVGIFGERDLLMRYADKEDGSWRDEPVRDHMVSDVVTLPADAAIAYALNRMSVGDYRHVPIVDAAGHPIGLLSVRDIVAYLHDFISGG